MTPQSRRAQDRRFRAGVCSLLLGAVLVADPGHAREPAPPVHVERHTATASGDTYRIEVAQPLRNRSITLANDGSEVVANPRVVANGKRNWFSTADILAEVVRPGMTDRERALALWRFLVENRYHDHPAHRATELHDPVRFLNVYGYGYCDDAATNFMVLAELAGIQARVWGLDGHVVPEAFFEGDWRMLDPDGEIYYVDDDGTTIASVETLARRPDLLRKRQSPVYPDPEKLVGIFGTTRDNAVSESYRRDSEATHRMAFDLRPGESLVRHHENWGLRYSGLRREDGRMIAYPEPHHPERSGNGRFVFEPVFADDVFARGADAVENLRGVRGGAGWVLASDAPEGVLVYRFASPYPYLDGSVEIAGHGRVALAFSETGSDWTGLFASPGGAPVAAAVPLGGHFRNHDAGSPTYRYFLRVTLDGRLAKLRFTSDVQVAPLSLPALEPGANTIRYVDDTKGERNVRIELGWDPVRAE